jgi:hypothetical protein
MLRGVATVYDPDFWSSNRVFIYIEFIDTRIDKDIHVNDGNERLWSTPPLWYSILSFA